MDRHEHAIKKTMEVLVCQGKLTCLRCGMAVEGSEKENCFYFHIQRNEPTISTFTLIPTTVIGRNDLDVNSTAEDALLFALHKDCLINWLFYVAKENIYRAVNADIAGNI